MKEFWRGKRVFVTGHTGFKGSWMCLWLRRLGAEVVGYALPAPSDVNLFALARVGNLLTSLEGDVRDLDRLRTALREYRPEIVLHLAAQSLVRRSYDDPIETYSTNVMGTVNLLEAVRELDEVRSVVVVTSDKCYENREIERGYRESEQLGGRDPYSSSKASAELIVRAYRESFLADRGVPVGSARAGNVIGGGDWAEDRLIPDIMRSLIAGEKLYIRYPRAVRPWQHVLEPLSGYLLLAERLYTDGAEFAEGWNFAPPEEKGGTVSELVERLTAAWDEPLEVETHPGPHLHEHTLLRLDPAKAKRRLGWEPRLSLEEALSWIVHWYLGYRDGVDPRRLTEEQIERYEELDSLESVSPFESAPTARA